MSYDFNALLSQIQEHRRAQAWQEAVDVFTTLSGHCPMTPLLWLRYAHDASMLLSSEEPADAKQLRLDTLELGLAEFPGSALLHLHFVELLLNQDQRYRSEPDKIQEAFQRAIHSIGRGSYRYEKGLVEQLYRHYVTFVAQTRSPLEALQVFVDRSQMPYVNETLTTEVQDFAKQHRLQLTEDTLQAIENGRRQAATWFGDLDRFEEDIDVAMEQEGVLPSSIDFESPIDWDSLIQESPSTFWMGLGGTASAQAFIRYAQTCARFESDTHEQTLWIQSLTFNIYERGVAECPTVEALWKAYLQHVEWLLLHHEEKKAHFAAMLQTVCNRAFANCPYSFVLAESKIRIQLTLATAGQAVLDPDALLQTITEILETKFLTQQQQHLDLYLTAIRTVKRRILSLLLASGSVEYDQVFDDGKNKDDLAPTVVLGEEAEQEVSDLVEDLREMYDTADEYLRQHHSNVSEGRFILWSDRSKTEVFLLTPLIAVLDEDQDNNGEPSSSSAREPFRCLEKLIKINSHPDSYRWYIQYLLNTSTSSAGALGLKFPRVRHHYQKAVNAMSTKLQPDRETTKHILCQEYLDFETIFGSDKSLQHASRLTKRKLKRYQGTSELDTWHGKRKHLEDEKSHRQEIKRARPEDDAISISPKPTVSADQDVEMQAEQTNTRIAEPKNMNDKDVSETSQPDSVLNTEENQPLGKHEESRTPHIPIQETKPIVHKIKVGNIEYPAHPFTVRVTNLTPEVDDMDLVDILRPKCGAIVHARIIREKHHHHEKGKSKGWGLVQFEERESVEKAVALHDTIGLHEKLLHVERSHMPAASLVSPGMHRIKPKGEGKVSKRNERKKDPKTVGDKIIHEFDEGGSEGHPRSNQTQHVEPSENTPSVSILSFQPRGVLRKGGRKPKLALN